MTPKEGLLEAFKCGVPERVPVTPWFGGGMWILQDTDDDWQNFPKSADKMAKTYVSINEKVQSDIIFVGSGMNNFPVAGIGGNIKYMTGTTPPDIGAPFLVNNEDDIGKLEATLESGKMDEDGIVQRTREATRQVVEKVGDETLVCLTAFGPFTYTGQFMGIENLMLNLAENPDFVQEVMRLATVFHKKYYEPLVDEGVLDDQMVVITDPMSAPGLISKDNWRNFVLPQHKELCEYYSSKGSYIWLHVCADWQPDDRWELIPQTGADIFFADPKFDIGFAKENLGGKICLGGNVDQINILNLAKAEEVKDAAIHCLETAAPGGGYMLSAGCDIPPTVPYDNVKMMIQMGKTTKYDDDGNIILAK
jgi:uroporphyrinogen decarboxylase|tara:strand:+ start:3345 stop:4436 length:1092 start_codon:yes stop_codon:yes gene_type:complete